MDAKLIENMLEAITKVVHASGPFREKAEEIKAACSEDDRTNLAEFLSWFDEFEA